MARLINRLSAARVKSAPAGMHPDGAGLYLRVDDDKNRYWVFRYASRSTGKDRQLGLGPLHTVSLVQAREKARACRQMLLAGTDPIDAKASQRSAQAVSGLKGMTFDQCRDAYVEAHRAGWRSAKHASDWTSSMTTYVTPVIGALPVAAIDTGLVLKVLEPIWKAKTETGSRVRGRIESVLAWATVRGYRSGPNPAQWKGHLDQMLPRRARVRKVEHFAALPYASIGAFMATLRTTDTMLARALAFLILTAARSGEVIGATWNEFDLAERVWVIPGKRMKGGREHRVPLSPSAIDILESLAKVRQGDRVFPVAASSLSRLPKDLGADETVHGFRSTFRDWAGEMTGYPGELAEAALAHANADKTEAAYFRSDLFERRRRMMDDWAAYCATIAPARGNVVSMRGSG